MNTLLKQWVGKCVPHRRLAGIAGVMIGSLVLACVTLLFHSASRMPWLAPTEANAQLLARCDRIAATAARQQCVEAVIAALQARGAEPRLAANQQAAVPDRAR